ncbi:hypothetical protein HY469_05265 [Candidatus Roizmanbacteria bacterium]|nr:hypothetical protein [Candidatus Roizmanbacteria bacterium]
MALVWDGTFGGLSDSKWSGIAGSFAECVGIDGHSTPGVLKVKQKLTKDSGSTVDAFVKERVAASNGYTFWFSSTTGKIWARSSGGTWTLAYTTVPAAGTAGCSGALEFNGYIYWATQSQLHRIAIANADDAWASVDLDWATFTKTDADFHPMAIQDITLFIGDGNQVAQVSDAGVFSANVLDINTPLRIKAIAAYDIDILLGTFVANTVNKTEIIRWDGVSPTWNTSDPIEEVGINAFIRDDNYMYVNAGRAGNLYFYNGQYLVPFKKIPGSYSSTEYGTVHPGSVGNFMGVPVFGFSNGAGNPAKQGVYSLGAYSRDYPKVLDLPYPISEGVTTGLEIGAIVVADFDLLVAWKNGSTFGVDKIDYTAKYASAYIETMILFQNKRDVLKTMANVSAFYNSLPASTGITFSYSINGAAYVAMTSVTNSDLNEIRAQLSAGGIGSLQIKMAFTVSSNDAPVIEAIAVDLE